MQDAYSPDRCSEMDGRIASLLMTASSVALFHVGLTITPKFALKVLRNCTGDKPSRRWILRCDDKFLLSSLAIFGWR
jgi:hypothetical protein